MRNDIFRAKAGLRLEQNQADGEGPRGTSCWRGKEREDRGAVRTETYLWSCVSAAPEPVAGTPGLQRTDAAPELVARTMGLRWCSTERGLFSGLQRGELRRRLEGGDRPRARRVQAGLCGWIGRKKKRLEEGKKIKRWTHMSGVPSRTLEFRRNFIVISLISL